MVSDMSPRGYLGRRFSVVHPDLNLPNAVRDWSNDESLIAVARRGEDGPGNLIIGDESFTRYLAASHPGVAAEQYPDLAQRSAEAPVGASAAGEQPKFAVYAEGRHVLVKFSGDDRGAASQRWRDLMACERVALEVLAESGTASAVARLIDERGMRFLEVGRFDRVGLRGRRGLLSLQAIEVAYFGVARTWTEGAKLLVEEGKLDADDARRMIWLDVFGQLIANDDRHNGNLSFFVDDDDSLHLAPVYDMLPMRFAPQGRRWSNARSLPPRRRLRLMRSGPRPRDGP